MASSNGILVEDPRPTPGDDDDEDDDGLAVERRLVREYMSLRRRTNVVQQPRPRRKDREESRNLRARANGLYLDKRQLHNSNKHQKMWDLFTRSVAAAPADSAELRLALADRSAFTYHVREYAESLKDCERALAATAKKGREEPSCSDEWRAKLLLRRVECLAALRKPSLKHACEEALDSLRRLDLSEQKREHLAGGRLTDILENNLVNNNNSNNGSGNQHKANGAARRVKKGCDKRPLPPDITATNLTATTTATTMIQSRSREAPCASSALRIAHSPTKWGRHVVATRRIEPGEVVVVEKSYFTSINPEGAYMFCSHCVRPTWASVPCKGCLFGVYCSERCKSLAWKRGHRYECQVLPYLYSDDSTAHPRLDNLAPENRDAFVRAVGSALRLMLSTVHECGGLQQTRRELRDLGTNRDARTRGFSADGVFHSDKCRSVLSLGCNRDNLHSETLAAVVSVACSALCHLASKSSFFGARRNEPAERLILDEDVQFAGALLLRCTLLLPDNMLKYFVHRESFILHQKFGASLHPFCSLFNHSCDPNVKSIPTKSNERLVYAKYAIEEGQQLFLCYLGDNYTSCPRDERVETIENTYYFRCRCKACEENWDTSLPFTKDILKRSPKLKNALGTKYKQMERFKNSVMTSLQGENFRYNPRMMKNLRKLMIDYGENVTVRSMDYEMFEHFIYMMLVNAFGTWLNISDSCESY